MTADDIDFIKSICFQGPDMTERQERRVRRIIDDMRMMARAPQTGESRSDRQRNTFAWALAAFGEAETTNLTQRAIRLGEEADETMQACGVTREMAHKMVDYVWDRPVGELAQELGGVGVTTLCLAAAAGLDADHCEADEVARVLAKPLKHFTERNAVKNDAGFLAAPPTQKEKV